MAKPKKGVEPAALRRWRLSHRRKRTTHHKTSKVTHMARRRYGRRRHQSRRSKRIPLGATIGGALAAYTAYRCWADNKTSYTKIRDSFMLRLTGYNTSTGAWSLKEAYIPVSLGAGVAVSAIGSKMKLNKYLPRPIAF